MLLQESAEVCIGREQARLKSLFHSSRERFAWLPTRMEDWSLIWWESYTQKEVKATLKGEYEFYQRQVTRYRIQEVV